MENNIEKPRPQQIGISIKLEEKSGNIWCAELQVKNFQMKEFLQQAGFKGKMEYTGKVSYDGKAESNFTYIRDYYGMSKSSAFSELMATYTAIMHHWREISGLTEFNGNGKTVSNTIKATEPKTV
jgi:hypothetical protein